jgi:ankyrin repeat protein
MSGGDWKELFRAACEGDIELLRYHVKNQVDVNYAHPEFLSTPLVACILVRQEAAANLLLDNGADPLLYSEFDGLTPVEAARQAGLARIEERLRDMGAPDPADVRRAGGWLQRVLGDRLPWYLR